ncbi:hypothetical protein ACHAXR_008376 [Thalassiosira sp. AJA248-18]
MNTSEIGGCSAEGGTLHNGVTPTEDDMSTPRGDDQVSATNDALKQGDAAAAAALASVDSAHQNTESSIDQDQDLKGEDSTNKSEEDVAKPPIAMALPNTDKPEDIPTPLPSSSDNKGMKRLSASVENVDLEYSLGSLDSPPPSKRQCFSLDPSSAPSSTGSKKKKISPLPPMKSFAEALKPSFWQDSASVSEHNKASASFDVADEEGGSSPLSVDGAGGPDFEEDKMDEGKKEANITKRRLSDEEERNIAEAEDMMRVAAMAASGTPQSADGPSENLERVVAKGKPFEKDSGDILDNFGGQGKAGMQNAGIGELNSNRSSASSLVGSYRTEEEYSRPLPPAPPSTPATAKDAFTPLPYHYDVVDGNLSYGDELRRDELKGSDQASFDADSATPPTENTGVPPPPFSEAETPQPDAKALAPDKKSRAYKYQKYSKHAAVPTPDLSGAVTEPRRGGGVAKQADQLRPRLTTTKSDFDRWDVGDRYQLKRMLGCGSYGEVAQAVDLHASRRKTEETAAEEEALPQQEPSSSSYVAVKKISNAFDQEVDAIRLYREMHILRRLRGHTCVIDLVDIVQPRSSDLKHFNDLYLVFEYVDTDLYKLIMSPQYLTTEHIQTFLYQMLVGLKYIHSSSVIHRDLKPAILLNEDCTLKICDFGLARIVHNNKISPSTTTQLRGAAEATVQDVTDEASHLTGVPRPSMSRQLTKHVVTRWYRAPELILIQPYASAVDIWSLGCIFGELLSMQEGSVPTYQDRVPLFPGGSCYPLSGDHASANSDERLDQLSVIFSVIGMPSEEDLKSVGKANEYISSLDKKPGRSLESLYPAADPAAINLLKKMLMFNPAKRCTACEALEHEFLKPVRRKDMEMCASQPLESPEFLEKSKIDLAMLKEETYKEILWYKQSH